MGRGKAAVRTLRTELKLDAAHVSRLITGGGDHKEQRRVNVYTFIEQVIIASYKSMELPSGKGN